VTLSVPVALKERREKFTNEWLWNVTMKFGPGAMVAAAFIGPGTVVTAITAGAEMGAALLWAVVFSVFATVVLQELALRTALAADADLAQLIHRLGTGRPAGWLLIALIVMAIGVGNSAYQSGNLTGAGLGLRAAFGWPIEWVIGFATTLGAGLIIADRYILIERVLSALVMVMALVFVGLAIILLPDFLKQPADRLIPVFTTQSTGLVLALIGTTVVPYNLFLHASAVRRRWQGVELDQALHEARWDSLIAIMVGGVITLAIILVAAVLVADVSRASAFEQLVQTVSLRFGVAGKWLVGGGLFAAGLTSAIAAPIAAGWAVAGALGWPTNAGSRGVKLIALTVLAVGAVFALFATRPIGLILSAQITNALVLPAVSAVLLLIANRAYVPAAYRNTALTNVIGCGVLLLVSVLAISKLWSLMS
jgi:manganese transport protein